MPRYAALLRGVNVGGNKKIAMADLRRVIEGLGHTDVATLLQSGNAVFTAAKGSAAAIAAGIESALAAEIGLQSTVFVLPATELDQAIAGNPFADAAEHDPSHLLLSFFAAPPPKPPSAIDAKYVATEEFALAGRVLYVWYRGGIGRSKLTGAVIERALGGPTTGRNWTTVTKLRDLLG